MRKFLNFSLFLIVIYLTSGIWHLASAIYNPLEVPNNRIGIHIFDPSEILQSAQLVNSSGGDWGYVTVPIRSDDRDYLKWEAFFRACSQYHLIPLVRLATYPINSHWAEPSNLDILDFANFLNLLPWPTQNRYIILFNEPNHSKEWGGKIDPENYVDLAQYSRDLFKSLSPDYFLLTAGLDMSAPNGKETIDALTYYRRMFAKDPNWLDYFDGFSFHPYPNPAFSASAFTSNRYGIRSYEFELKYLARFGARPKYLFFTETGTVRNSYFYTPAFTTVWKDTRIVAITPFVLFAGSGDFARFSLLDRDHKPTANYREILNLPKTAGKPLLAPLPSLSPSINQNTNPNPDQAPVKSFLKNLLNYFVK